MFDDALLLLSDDYCLMMPCCYFDGWTMMPLRAVLMPLASHGASAARRPDDCCLMVPLVHAIMMVGYGDAAPAIGLWLAMVMLLVLMEVWLVMVMMAMTSSWFN